MSSIPLFLKCSIAESPEHNPEQSSVFPDEESPFPLIRHNPVPPRPYGACSFPTAPQFSPFIVNRSARQPCRKLNKSQSQLIMPNLLKLFNQNPSRGVKRSEIQSPAISRDASFMSLYESSRSPDPLIRRCQTVTEFSDSSSGRVNVHTKVIGDKRKTSFIRRLHASRSAIFGSTKVANSSGSSTTDFQKFCRFSTFYLKEEDSVGSCSRCASTASVTSRTFSSSLALCKLCCTDVSVQEMYELQQCQCRFCKYCMTLYTTLKIREGSPTIECPDASCDCCGELNPDEVEALVGRELLELHLKFKSNREIDSDPFRTWCPHPGCETVVFLSSSKIEGPPEAATCPACSGVFCSSCSEPWHPRQPCLSNVKLKDKTQIPMNEFIKRCPKCKVPIERDAGCAQMQCKKCKHVFCWYCLASLEDDFLLRHYDKGPCKNKLGHSRASVLWHRAQVIGIFAGFGMLLVVASPVLLIVGPCLLCCKCSPRAKQEAEEESEAST